MRTTLPHHQLALRNILTPPGLIDRYLLSTLVVMLGLHTSWIAFGWGPLLWQPVLADVLADLTAVIGVAFAWRGVKLHSDNLRRGWTFIALGISSAAIGDMLWSFLELVVQADPFPSVADFFYLLLIPLFLLGFYYLAPLPIDRHRQIRLHLDALILIAAAGVLSWHFFFAPLILENNGDVLTLTVSLAYPALDLVLFSLLTLIVLRQDSWDGLGVAFFAAGLICFIVADLSYSLLVAAEAYASGHPIDVLWTVSTALFALAVWADQYRTALPTSSSYLAATWKLYLPYLAIALSYLLLFTSFPYVNDRGDPLTFLGVLMGTAFVTFLVVMRQVLVLRENLRLSHQLKGLTEVLEARVQGRTAELDRANQGLLALSQTLELKVQLRTAELEASRAKLAYQAQHDALTGLLNRAALEEQLQLAVTIAGQSGRSLALFFIDLDGFKLVNDTFDHTIGDALLKGVAFRLRESLRHSDTLARLGGDEFVVLLPDFESPRHVEQLVIKLLAVLREPFILNGPTVCVGASIGVSLYPHDATDAATLQRHADIAMYRAKHSGKNSYRFFTPDVLN